MSDFFGGSGFLFLLFMVAIAGGALTFYLLRASRKGEAPSLLDFLLVWPIIFRAERDSSKKTSARFVLGGLAFALVLIVIGTSINKR